MEREFPWKDNAVTAVSFTFDDARISQIENGIPLFTELDVSVTFYVSPASVMERLADWKRVAGSGHEIGCHTYRHPCSGNFRFGRENPLESYTLDTMETDCREADEFIQEHIGVIPETFAYPCGQTYVGRGTETRSYVPLIAKRYRAGRVYRNESANAPLYCDVSQLTSFASDGESAHEMIRIIDTAAEANEWVIFAGHEIGNQQHQQNTSIGALREVLEYVKKNSDSVYVAPVNEVAEYLIAMKSRMEGNHV